MLSHHIPDSYLDLVSAISSEQGGTHQTTLEELKGLGRLAREVSTCSSIRPVALMRPICAAGLDVSFLTR